MSSFYGTVEVSALSTILLSASMKNPIFGAYPILNNGPDKRRIRFHSIRRREASRPTQSALLEIHSQKFFISTLHNDQSLLTTRYTSRSGFRL